MHAVRVLEDSSGVEVVDVSEPSVQEDHVLVRVGAAGTTTSLVTAVDRCRRGATVLGLATYWDRTELPGLALSEKLPRAVITDRIPLEGGAHAFARAADRSAGSIKVVIEGP